VRLSCSERPRCKASLHIAGHVKPGLGDFGLDTAPIMVNHLLQFPTQGADQPRHLLADGLHLFQCADAVVAKSMNKVELSLSRAKRSPRGRSSSLASRRMGSGRSCCPWVVDRESTGGKPLG
jgi:hypothetical protein